MSAEYVWIINRARTVRRIKRDDPRLDWNWAHAPDRMVKFAHRKSWEYVYYGASMASAVEAFNWSIVAGLMDLEEKLEKLER